MSAAVTVTELVRNFADYVNRVAYRHESFVLMKGSRAVAELKPVPDGCSLADLPEIIAAAPRLEPGDEEAFARDIISAAEELAAQGVSDPWDS